MRLQSCMTTLVGWHRGHTCKSSTHVLFWAFLVLWSMMIQELRDANGETLSNLYYNFFLNHPCQPKLYCTVYAYCAAPLPIIAFKQNSRVASICYVCKTMRIVAFLCYTQIIYSTNTNLWTASNVRIPISTVIITYFGVYVNHMPSWRSCCECISIIL